MSMHSSPPSVVASALAADRLGVGSVAQFVLTAATPMLVVAGVVTTGWAVTGITAIPIAFAFLAIVLALFSIGYMAMARRIVNAGALYTYITHGLGRPLGVAAALIAVWSYNLMQVAAYGIFGFLAADMTDHKFTWWQYALVAWALVAVFGMLRIDLNSRVLAVLLTGEIFIVVVFAAVSLIHPAGGHVAFTALNPTDLIGPGLGAALAIAFTGFVGFEQAPIYSEESRSPRRTVPTATYGAVALMGVVYCGASWAMSVTIGPDTIVQAAAVNGPDLLFVAVTPYLSSTVVTIGHWLFLSSVFAGLVAYHNATARYTYALGRERVLPAWCARTSLRTGAPIGASILQTMIGLAVIATYAAAGWDPLVNLFFWLGVVGGLGILLLLTVASIAIVGYFLRNPGDGYWRCTIAPLAASILLTAVFGYTLANYATLLGVPPTSPWRWIFPTIHTAIAALGVLWALSLRATRPDIYERIGRGATATPDTTAPATRTVPAGAPR